IGIDRIGIIRRVDDADERQPKHEVRCRWGAVCRWPIIALAHATLRRQRRPDASSPGLSMVRKTASDRPSAARALPLSTPGTDSAMLSRATRFVRKVPPMAKKITT